jgi:hypothetical protein
MWRRCVKAGGEASDRAVTGNPLAILCLLQPAAMVAATVVLLLVYYRRRLLTVEVLAFSGVAYFAAIAAKALLQARLGVPTNPLVAGLYYGLQTVVLEIGLAYAFARYAVKNKYLQLEQAPAFGASLAFWENGLLLGLLAIPGLLIAIVSGGAGASDSPSEILQLVGLGTMERVGSVLAHFSWGVLVAVAAATGRWRYLAVALPMGLIDMLVPFAPLLPLWAFESIVLALSALCLGVAYLVTRSEWPALWTARRGGEPRAFGVD